MAAAVAKDVEGGLVVAVDDGGGERRSCRSVRRAER